AFTNTYTPSNTYTPTNTRTNTYTPTYTYTYTYTPTPTTCYCTCKTNEGNKCKECGDCWTNHIKCFGFDFLGCADGVW
ncbi:MAG: hypothetical protein AB1782_12205, partial [Cyanobacteriota bacterium]